MIVAALTMGMALSDIPTKLEARKGMRKPKTKQTLDTYLSCLGSIALLLPLIRRSALEFAESHLTFRYYKEIRNDLNCEEKRIRLPTS